MDSTRSPPLSRGSGAVVESPLLNPLLLHQEAKGGLDTHIQRKWLQLLWGLPHPVHSSLEQSVPALPGFLACTALQEATDHQRPLFEAERRLSLEHHLREKMVYCKWGLPERIKRVLQLPFPPEPLSTVHAAHQGRPPPRGGSATRQPSPAATLATTTTTTKAMVADGSRSLPTVFLGIEVAMAPSPLEIRPCPLAVPREQWEALSGAEVGQLEGGLCSFQPACSSPPAGSAQAAPRDEFWSAPEGKGLSRRNPQEWERQVHRGPALSMSHGGSSSGSPPLAEANSRKRRPALGMGKPLQKPEVAPQRTEVTGGPGQLLQASPSAAPRVALVTAEKRVSGAPERAKVVFYVQEKSTVGQAPPRSLPLATRQGKGQREESIELRERTSPGPLAVSPAGRDLELVHQEGPAGSAGQPSCALSQEGLREPECAVSLEGPSQKPNLARIGSRAVLKGDGLGSQAVCFHESMGRSLTHSGAGPQDGHTKARLTDDRRRYFELHLREKLLHQRWGFPRRLQEFLLQPTLE